MLQYTSNLSPLHPKSDMEILILRIQHLEQELSDLNFEFKREMNDRRRT
jgi:hypothetical protein